MTTYELASLYFKDQLTSNKIQHLYNITEEKALEIYWRFEGEVIEERDKNTEYYNKNQIELIEKYHHLLENK